MDINQLRREYFGEKLEVKDLNSNPIQQFKAWLKQAVDAKIEDPTAMTLSTVNELGCPSQRIVLLKEVSENGFDFFTNLKSRKAQDILNNPMVSLHFPWNGMNRQVHIIGKAQRTSLEVDAEYFLSRPKESQISAWASPQSYEVESREVLLSSYQDIKEKYGDGPIPCPSFWGGFRILPSIIEFWVGREYRLHDRFFYQKNENNVWNLVMLAP